MQVLAPEYRWIYLRQNNMMLDLIQNNLRGKKNNLGGMDRVIVETKLSTGKEFLEAG